MQFILWITVVAAVYIASWYWVVSVALSWYARSWTRLLPALVGAGVGAWIMGAGFAFPLSPLAPVAVLALSGALSRRVGGRPGGAVARKRRKEVEQDVALHLALISGCVLFSLPFVWMILTSFKPDDQIFSNPTSLPSVWMFSNYPKTLEFLETSLGRIRTYHGGLFVFNTLYVTALSLTGVLFSSSMVAYSFARLRWPGRDALFMILLGTMMLPQAVTMIPTFLIFRQLGWIDTLRPLWVGGLFGGAFNIFLLRQFYLTIPNDLEDAAKIDGCSYFTIYWRVMLPLIKPALAALAIMHFMATWNDFMGPLIYISSPKLMTGSYALQLFKSANSGEWALLLCAATLWTLPVVLLFFFTQRYFIQGITLTGIKG